MHRNRRIRALQQNNDVNPLGASPGASPGVSRRTSPGIPTTNKNENKSTQHNTTQIKSNKEIRLPSVQDSPLCGGDFEHNSGEYCVVVDVPLDWPMAKDAIAPYTPPPEDYYRVVEASLGIRVSKLGVLAKREIERIYFDGLCGKARGYTKKAIPFNNWVAYVVKCLWKSFNEGLLRGCRQPRRVVVAN